MKEKRVYGWKPQLPDFRDNTLTFSSSEVLALPSTNQRANELLPDIWNQGPLGSCTAHGILRAFLACAKAENNPVPMLSRLMLYYLERAKEGTINQDAGAIIRTGIKTLAKEGSCDEDLWPYSINNFAKNPPQECYENALKYNALQYRAITPTVDQIKAAILQSRADGKPSIVVFGMPVYSSFESNQTTKTGLISIPSRGERQIGGHCMAFNGFWDDSKQLMGLDNSYGKTWGDKGTGYLPYWYLNNGLVSDCWVFTDIEDPESPNPNPPVPSDHWTITITGTGPKPTIS